MAKLYETTGEKGHISRKRATPPPPPVYAKSEVVNETNVDQESEEVSKLVTPIRTSNIRTSPVYETPRKELAPPNVPLDF